jgi:hypothetical protein
LYFRELPIECFETFNEEKVSELERIRDILQRVLKAYSPELYNQYQNSYDQKKQREARRSARKEEVLKKRLASEKE